MKCSQCGADDQYRLYYDVLSPEGVITLCKSCKDELGYAVLRKRGNFEASEFEKKQTVYERMQRISGVRPRENREESDELKDKNKELKELLDNKIKESVSEKTLPTEDLVDNFHWVIMRIRRSKKMTIEQLAREIGEPEMSVKMLEQGKISASSPRIINKIENALGVRLRKKSSGFPEQDVSSEELARHNQHEPVNIEGTELSFDPATAKTIRISDLKNLKRMKEEESINKKWSNKEKEQTLSDKEIDDILYGR